MDIELFLQAFILWYPKLLL